MNLFIESIIIIIVVFAATIPHELAHIAVFKIFGVPSHIEYGWVDFGGRFSSWAVMVVPNDETQLDALDRYQMTLVGFSGGWAGALFIHLSLLLLIPWLSTCGFIMFVVAIFWNIVYAIQEAREGWSEKWRNEPEQMGQSDDGIQN